LNQPFALFLALSAETGVYDSVAAAFGTYSATADMNYYDTLSFPTSGPVFNLPSGYTVNSVEGDIVNNAFLGGPAASVPEPSSLVLIGTALLGLYVARRRDKSVSRNLPFFFSHSRVRDTPGPALGNP